MDNKHVYKQTRHRKREKITQEIFNIEPATHRVIEKFKTTQQDFLLNVMRKYLKYFLVHYGQTRGSVGNVLDYTVYNPLEFTLHFGSTQDAFLPRDASRRNRFRA